MRPGDVEARFHPITGRHGRMPANQCLSFFRSVYRRPCVDHEDLRNPVEQWLAAGGRYHHKTRRRISSPAVVLPCWRRGIAEPVDNPVHRDLLLFGLYAGMRRGEIMPLTWERVDLEALLFRVEETKTKVPLELPVTRQLGKILARRRADRDAFEAYVEKVLVPELSPSDLVVMDNLSTHKGPRVRCMIEEAGAQMLFLPPYRPDLYPIEQAFSKLKARLRKAAERTVDGLWNAIGQACESTPPR